jgi:RNA polymerase sigma-70 factor, ECF subfamily
MDPRQQLLVLRAQAGDRDAMEALLIAWEKPLYEFLARVISSSSMAEDVLQEVLIIVVRKLHLLRDPAAFRGWALRISSREAIRTLKKMRQWPRSLEEPEAAVDPRSDPTDGLDRLEHLPALLAAASPASRLVLELHYLQSLSLAEIAALLNIPIGTVKSRLSYGVQSIRNTTSRFM